LEQRAVYIILSPDLAEIDDFGEFVDNGDDNHQKV
jgi:hypothetical protein